MSGRVESEVASYLLRAPERGDFANETCGQPHTRGSIVSNQVTARRVEAIRTELQTRDWQILEHVSTARILSGYQLRQLTGTKTVSQQRALRGDLNRLTNQLVLCRLGRRIGGKRAGSDGYAYGLDVAGQRLIDPRPRRRWRRPWSPSVRTLQHAIEVSDLYVEDVPFAVEVAAGGGP